METGLPPEIAGNAGYLLSRLGLRARRLFGETIAELGIRPPHFGILSLLAAHGALAQTQLSAGLRLDRGQLVGLLDELEAEGLVSREPDPADRRRHAVTLTEEGRRRQARALALAIEAEGQLLDALTPDERAELRRLLLRLAVQ